MKTIVSVPESLTKEQYTSLVESVGFAPSDVRRLEFRHDGVYAEVFDRDENGRIRMDRQADEVVVNRVWIPVRD